MPVSMVQHVIISLIFLFQILWVSAKYLLVGNSQSLQQAHEHEA